MLKSKPNYRARNVNINTPSATGLSDSEIRKIFARPVAFPSGVKKHWVPSGPIVEVTRKNGKMVSREIKAEKT